MKSLLRMLLLLSLLPLLSGALAPPGGKLRVVTTLPDLADIVREIGGERVKVKSLYRGKENTHALTAKPSHLVAMSKADLFVQVGLSLESNAVPGLMENSRNARIQAGRPGFVSVSDGWEAIDVPTDLSRKGGDLHPQGNPHMNLDPRAGPIMADRILAGLIAVDPGGKALFEKRHADLVARMHWAREHWDAMGAHWKGEKIVVYHQEYDYLARYHGLEIVGKVEPKPGIPPTPNHVASLIVAIRDQGVKAILTAPWSKNRTVARIAEKTGVPVVELPSMCGGLPDTNSWIDMMNELHRRVAMALGDGQ